jgi:hypothetical protein
MIVICEFDEVWKVILCGMLHVVLPIAIITLGVLFLLWLDNKLDSIVDRLKKRRS